MNGPIEVRTHGGNTYRFHRWLKTSDGSIVGLVDKPPGRYVDTLTWRSTALVVPVDSIQSVSGFDDYHASTAQIVFSVVGIAVCAGAIVYVLTQVLPKKPLFARIE